MTSTELGSRITVVETGASTEALVEEGVTMSSMEEETLGVSAGRAAEVVAGAREVEVGSTVVLEMVGVGAAEVTTTEVVVGAALNESSDASSVLFLFSKDGRTYEVTTAEDLMRVMAATKEVVGLTDVVAAALKGEHDRRHVRKGIFPTRWDRSMELTR